MYDISLLGGSVVEHTGGTPRRADLAIAGGRIAAIGELTGAEAHTVIDVTGQLLFPGFVDAHVHADAVLTRPEVQEAILRQGITSVVLGQDGLSYAPGSAETVAYVSRYFAAVDGAAPEEFANGCSVADLLGFFDRRTPVNVAYLVPLGTVRQDVLGSGSVRANDAELTAMAALVAQGLDEGAVGVSTGLEYVPGVFADLHELTALCAPAAQIGAPYVSHLRSYDDGARVGMAEAADIGKATGIPLHISHYRGQASRLIARLEECIADGLDVTFDSYPHLWANTILAMKALPATLQEGGVDATLSRLADPAVRAQLARDWFPTVEQTISPSVLGFVASSRLRWAEGLTVAAAAERMGMSFGDAVCELILDSDVAVGAIVPAPSGAGESDVRELLRHRAHMGCSDGIYLGGHPHPRGWGAFAQFLGKHTRELGDWTWNEASWHLSGHPAARFGLAGRGTLAVGNVADIAVVDPEAVGDRATYDEPRLLAGGVNHVLVAGEPVLVEGKLTGATPGRPLRRGEVGL